VSPHPDNRLSGFDLQGHRGARGLLPENTIPAFLHALSLGVSTLEMDTVINAQGSVVVSHEHWMSATTCSHPDGSHVSEKEEKNLRIYAMSDRQVAAYDCGRRGHPDFARQRPMPAVKPLLRDVFLAVASHAGASGRGAGPGAVRFNIEIKSLPEYDGIFHPPVTEFAELLHGLLVEFEVLDRTTIQSFDVRALEAIHQADPVISTSLIVDNNDGLQSNLGRLSFTPSIYSPFYKLLDRQQIDAAHKRNTRVIPWTINDDATMRKLLGMGVDGLITDYPDLGMDVLNSVQEDLNVAMQDEPPGKRP
jgi:glycerophosphoryl diester phosphodiesterase